MSETVKPSPRGKFVWYEYLGPDLGAAVNFYSQVVGWTARDGGMPGMAYWMLGVGPNFVAGVAALSDEMKAMGIPPCWSGYVWVDDVDAAVQQAVAAGGALNRAPMDIPGVGRFAVIADPQGAVILLFRDRDGNPSAPLAPSTPGAVGWRELYTGDAAAALAFYSGLLGWKPAGEIDMGPMGAYRLFESAPGEMGGMFKPPGPPAAYWLYFFTVEAMDAAVASAIAGGGKILTAPEQVPGGAWAARIRDPFGAGFGLTAARR